MDIWRDRQYWTRGKNARQRGCALLVTKGRSRHYECEGSFRCAKNAEWHLDGWRNSRGVGLWRQEFLCFFCFKGRRIAKCDQHRVVYSDGVINESSDDCLDVGDVRGREDGYVFLGIDKLLIGSIDRLLPFVGCVLWS